MDTTARAAECGRRRLGTHQRLSEVTWAHYRGRSCRRAPTRTWSGPCTSCTTGPAGPASVRSRAHAGVSHTTVSKVFSSSVLPPWGTVELLVEAMGGSRAEFHALWLAASSSAGDGAPPPPSPGIAGRRAELAVVRDHLDGGGGLLVVTGEAGIGKSTLVDAAAALTDTRVAVGRCLPFSTEVPLMPVVELLRSIHDADDGRWIGEALSDCPAYAA